MASDTPQWCPAHHFTLRSRQGQCALKSKTQTRVTTVFSEYYEPRVTVTAATVVTDTRDFQDKTFITDTQCQS